MEKRLQVCWWDGSLVGHLVQRGTIYFVYDEAWIKKGHHLSPLNLPFAPIAFSGNKGIDGLPGLIADCIPDSWGRKMARKEFASNKWGEPTLMSLLAWRGTRGLGALQFLPALDKQAHLGKLETISAEALARGAEEIERGEAREVLPQLARGGTAGGAFPKALVIHYDDGTLRVGNPDGTGIPCLLKFDLSKNNDIGPSEHVYALMARSAGIRAVETRLIGESHPEKRRHLLVKRFDIPGQSPKQRIHFHSLSGLLHKEAGSLDYRDMFRSAIRLGMPTGELRELARRMVFNVLSSNHDDHGKNHAFLYNEESREWSLTPAYDMTYSQGILERGMLVNGEVWPSAGSMETLCQDAGLSKEEFRQVVSCVEAALAQWQTLSQKAGLSPAMVKEVQERHELIRSRVHSP